ncbi:MAG TPA: cytosine permease [Nevskiaceae bacterium]
MIDGRPDGGGERAARGAEGAARVVEALTPIPEAERQFGWRDHASLWFAFGLGLLVIQAGTFLVPSVSTRDAMIATAVGSVIGTAVLAWTARLGCVTGLTSAGLMYRAFGRGLGRIPVGLNVLQLIGWATFELVILRDAILAIARHGDAAAAAQAWAMPAATVLCGLVLALLLVMPMVQLVQRIIERVTLPLVILALVWVTWWYAVRFPGFSTATGHTAGAGSGSMFSAMDLVMAYPISWLPLVADYARHGRREGGQGARKAFSGTFIGYAIANLWSFGLGVMMVANGATLDNATAGIAVVQGGLVVLGLVLIHELSSNAYGDIYSAAVSSKGIWSRVPLLSWSLVLTVVCTALALVLPIESMQPFLLLLSSVFMPLFGVILGRLGTSDVDALRTLPRRIDVPATVVWLLGIVVFQLISRLDPNFGSTLPTLAVTFALGWLTRPRQARNVASAAVRGAAD